MKERGKNEITVDAPHGVEEKYEILANFPFSS